MSTMNLNLLPSKAKFQATKIKTQRTVGKIVLGIAAVWGLALVIVLGLSWYTNFRVDAAEKQLKKVEINYQEMSDDIITSQKLKYMAKVVGGVLNSRFEYGRAFETVQNIFPPGIVLKNYNLREDGVFVVEGETTDKVNVDLLESTLTDINSGKKEKLLFAKMTTLSVKNNLWNFGMEVGLK